MMGKKAWKDSNLVRSKVSSGYQEGVTKSKGGVVMKIIEGREVKSSEYRKGQRNVNKKGKVVKKEVIKNDFSALKDGEVSVSDSTETVKNDFSALKVEVSDEERIIKLNALMPAMMKDDERPPIVLVLPVE